MAIPEMIEQALHSKSPFEELRTTAAALLARGQTTEDVHAVFEASRAQLRSEGREKEEDVVMEVMDCLVGWCSPQVLMTPTDREPPVQR